ncbi:MAG: 16S rRNA processing protein RimM [Spirochaetes bacterium]|nr:16S rRNA processing protein RimM [Spirochaetota bacterium]
MSNEYIRVGKILGTFGLDGSLKVKIITDFPERFDDGNQLYININGFYKKQIIKDSTLLKDRLVRVKFNGVDGMESAQTLIDYELFVDSAEIDLSRNSLDENTFYQFEIVGLDVFYKGKPFGVLKEVIEAGGGDTLVIERNGKEFFVPFVRSMVSVDLEKKEILLTPPDGLIESQS